MSLNSTLKNVLIRTLYIVGSLFVFILLAMPYSLPVHKTLYGIWQLVVALAIIWYNIRKLAKPIQLITIGSYLFVFAGLICWYKVDDMSMLNLWGITWNYRIYERWLILACLGFILLASVLPIFLKSTNAPKLTKFGKVWIWTAILILDFVAAMPNIYFTEQQADKLYMGLRKMGGMDRYVPIYAVGISDSFGVFIPQDSIYTSPAHYLKVYYERHGNLLIQPETQDTIWIEKGGVWANPNRQTIENNTSCLMRWQWQYYAWHKVKGLFCKEENER